MIVSNVQDFMTRKWYEELEYSVGICCRLLPCWMRIEEFQIDACIGGAQRDEDKGRARALSFRSRDDF